VRRRRRATALRRQHGPGRVAVPATVRAPGQRRGAHRVGGPRAARTAGPERAAHDLRRLSGRAVRAGAICRRGAGGLTRDRMHLDEILAETAERTPHRPAVTCGTRQLTYGELDAQVTRVASGFR